MDLNDIRYIQHSLSNLSQSALYRLLPYVEEKLEKNKHSLIDTFMLDVIKKNPTCCFTMEKNVAPFEGSMACQYGTVYECVMGFGNIHIVEDSEEKIEAMKVLMKTQTGKDDFEFDARMLTIVTVMRIDVNEISAKRRPMPGSEH